jgi:hypothetical protein
MLKGVKGCCKRLHFVTLFSKVLLRYFDTSFLWVQYMFGRISNFFKNLIDERNIWLSNTKNIPNVAPILNDKK